MHYSAAIVFALLAAGPLAATCRPVESLACVIRLHGDERSISDTCSAEAWRDHLRLGREGELYDADADGWWEAVLEIEVDPASGCNCAVFRVHYGDEPTRFSLNIGDSATNDGYGGDAGSDPLHSAELQIQDRDGRATASVFSTLVPGIGTDQLLQLYLPSLKDRFVEIEICDQFVGIALDGNPDGPGSAWLRSGKARALFAFGDLADGEGERKPDSPDATIYAGFNRVIRDRSGPPAHDRVGSGVERVEIFLTP